MRLAAWIALLFASVAGCAHNSATDRGIRPQQQENGFPITKAIINHYSEDGYPKL